MDNVSHAVLLWSAAFLLWTVGVLILWFEVVFFFFFFPPLSIIEMKGQEEQAERRGIEVLIN